MDAAVSRALNIVIIYDTALFLPGRKEQAENPGSAGLSAESRISAAGKEQGFGVQVRY
jgi:hypothetical protein